MGRTGVLITVVAAFGAGVATGWLVADRRPSPSPERPADSTSAASLPEPDRGPELFGIIEEIRRPSPGWLRVRLACRPPERPEQKSPQSEHEGERRSVYIVHVRDATIVRQRSGGTGELAEQQVVSVWWQGEVATSLPPQVGAVRIVIEQQPP